MLGIFIPVIKARQAPRPRIYRNVCALKAELASSQNRVSIDALFNFADKAKLAMGTAGPAAPRDAVPRNNFIDDYIFNKIERDRIPSAALCTDEEFIRRVYLDLIGRIPTADNVRQFSSDSNPNKRAALVDNLIGTPEFVDRWTMWFGDFLRNTIYPVAPQGRNLLYEYIKNFVRNNTPYNQVVRDLLTARGDNYTSGPVNYLMKAGTVGDNFEFDTWDDMAVATARNFLGVKILCISCHRGAGYLNRINYHLTRFKREDLWGQSAFFTQMNIQARFFPETGVYRYGVSDDGPGVYAPTPEDESFRPARRPTQPVSARYLFTGEQPANSNLRGELARIITSDPQFARATVNYLWTQFMVTGIVDPPDSFDLARQDPNNPPPAGDPIGGWWRQNAPLQPSHPELLSALAADFVAKGYDLRSVMRLICKSSAYQLSSTFPGQWKPEYARYYARKIPRVLTSEEIHDAIQQASGINATYLINGSSERVRWAMQLPGPEEPLFYLDRDANIDGVVAFSILEAFGRGDRFLNERKVNRYSLFQPLSLMHSYFVALRTDATAPGKLQSLLGGGKSNNEIVDELFLSTVSRLPSAAEKQTALARLNGDRTEGAESLLWGLFNKLDFIVSK